ncbi:MAG: class I SAM-dependent methyltransferase [Promethearchaeota archaeon]
MNQVKKYEKRFYIYQRMLNLRPTDSILDLGCGQGILITRFKNLCKHVTGVDISEEAIKIASRLNPECEFLIKDIEDLNFAKKSFDIVYCFETLQYIQNQQLALRKMFEFARRAVVISVPNYDSLWAQLIKAKQALIGIGCYPNSPTTRWFKKNQISNFPKIKYELHSFATKMEREFSGTIRFHLNRLLTNNLYIVARYDL